MKTTVTRTTTELLVAIGMLACLSASAAETTQLRCEYLTNPPVTTTP